MPSIPFEPEPGKAPFPGYKLVRLRGRGGFATVWESESPLGKNVALKFISSQNVSTTARELKSIQAIQSVSHPHLLRNHGAWTLPGYIVLEMELAEASLLDLLELYLEEFGHPIEPDKLCRYMVHVATALDFLNSRRHRIEGRLVGLQHGDVKPNNILLINDNALLADYGLASPTQGPLTPCHRQGTPEYCAPEVFMGNLTDSSDQFSLAVTYFVLRTAKFPYPPTPTDRTKLKDYRRPEPNLDGLTPAETQVLLRGLSTVPQQRYRSCAELISALIHALGYRLYRDEEGRYEVGPPRGITSYADINATPRPRISDCDTPPA